MEDSDTLFDRVLHSVGDEGPFQRRYNLIFNFLLATSTTMVYMNIILALTAPDHWCHVPGREENVSIEDWKIATLPLEINPYRQEVPSSCLMYQQDDAANEQSTDNVTACQYGYEYDTTWYANTATSSQDWVCDKNLYPSNILASARLGEVLAGFVVGYLGDTIGRRPVFVIAIILSSAGRLASPFLVSWYPLFMAASILATLPSVAAASACLVITMELSPTEDRAFVLQLQNFGWTTGLCLLPLLHWACGDWLVYIIASTAPILIYIPLTILLVESPRWLLSRGRVAECLQQLQVIAKVNGTRLSPDSALLLQNTATKPEKTYGIGSLFSGWRLAKNTLLMVICWMCCILSYNTLVLNVTSLSGNPYMNFFYQSVAELPSYLVGRVFCDWLGRRFTGASGFLLSAMSFIIVIFTMQDSDMIWLQVALNVFAKFAISISYFSTALQALEIYPTNVRQSGNSLGAVAGNVMSILAPYIVYLGTTMDARIPYAILSLICLLGATIEIFLPETLHERLPETVQEARKFGADQQYFSFPRKKRDLYVLANMKILHHRISENYDKENLEVEEHNI